MPKNIARRRTAAPVLADHIPAQRAALSAQIKRFASESGAHSAWGEVVVQADQRADGGEIVAKLERDLSGGATRLVLEARGGIISDDGDGAYPTRIELLAPNSLEVLVSVLLQLIADEHGSAILASIGAEVPAPLRIVRTKAAR